ncbi:(2Fe-2S)-binding protein [Pararhizobium sp. DWP3-4]|uniref:(2Fe-2S)-binding protein n=1 Tax=Pararhizobium sp. DWP3-4 TaxID=2804565 RepID=UPI003CF26F81
MDDELSESPRHNDRLLLLRREILLLSGSAAVATLPLSRDAAFADDVGLAAPHIAAVCFTINSQRVCLEIDTRLSLLDLLRERLALTGTKKGCNQGACGACTIHVNSQRIISCLALAVLHDGSEITTIEGIAAGDNLHPLQDAFIEHEGFQCGYCTSGQIMSGLACINEGHAGSRHDISEWMSGNICRCGAYPGIIAAIEQAAKGERT